MKNEKWRIRGIASNFVEAQKGFRWKLFIAGESINEGEDDGLGF